MIGDSLSSIASIGSLSFTIEYSFITIGLLKFEIWQETLFVVCAWKKIRRLLQNIEVCRYDLCSEGCKMSLDREPQKYADTAKGFSEKYRGHE